jgi:hypothetical protein
MPQISLSVRTHHREPRSKSPTMFQSSAVVDVIVLLILTQTPLLRSSLLLERRNRSVACLTLHSVCSGTGSYTFRIN